VPRRVAVSSSIFGWAVLALLAGYAFLGSALLPARAADEVVPDYEFYKANVAPVVERVCAECHAIPRKRLGKHFLKPMPGRSVRESHHRDNYEMILELIEPGNPAASLWLLKPLGPGQGGVTHKGGQRVRLDSLEYGVMVDFIQGRTLTQRAFQPPPTPEGQPDFAFYYARIAPTLANVCAECHGGKGQGRHALRTAPRGEELPLADHYANYETVLTLTDRQRPEKSRFLLKPLALADGGLPHRGGDRIVKGDANHVNWLAFLKGERGPPLPTGRRQGGPPLLESALTLEAEAMERDASLEERFDALTPEKKWMVAEAKAGRLSARVRVPEAGDYAMKLAVVGGAGPLGVALDGGPPVDVEVPAAGRAEVGPRFLLDGAAALRAPRGDLRVEAGRLVLDGRGGEASFLAASEVDHQAVEARLALASEEDGGDDAWLCFDMLDPDNGKLLGLVDGGRRCVMGLLEGGVPRILTSAKSFLPEPGATSRRLRVEYLEGVAVGRLDGQPMVFLHLDRLLGQGGFGLATHGVLTVESLEAIQQFPVHKVGFGEGPILHLGAGIHSFEIELPADGAGLDSLTLTLQSN